MTDKFSFRNSKDFFIKHLLCEGNINSNAIDNHCFRGNIQYIFLKKDSCVIKMWKEDVYRDDMNLELESLYKSINMLQQTTIYLKKW